MALGELIIEDKGKITGQRVLHVEGPKIESSFVMEGKYKGAEGTDIGTYSSVLRQGEGGGVAMYGEGQGVVTTKDGQEMATWTGQGIGRFSSPGKISFRGSLFFSTNSKDGKLSFLNNLVGVFEYEVDEMGNCSSKVWEWK